MKKINNYLIDITIMLLIIIPILLIHFSSNYSGYIILLFTSSILMSIILIGVFSILSLIFFKLKYSFVKTNEYSLSKKNLQ